MKAIMLPTDYSPAADAATEVAATIALKQQAERVLFHVVEVLAPGSFNVEGGIDN